VNARSRFVLITLATVLGMGITASLGRWQLHRAAEKEALQAGMDAQSGKHVVNAAALLSAAEPVALVHQHARFRGEWLVDHTLYLDNRQMNAKVGFYVMTPLRLQGSAQVLLVQRGWVQRNFEERDKLPAIETPSGDVDIEGRIALPPGKLFELGAAPSTRIRQNLDLPQMQAELQAPVLPVILVQTGPASGGLLRDWPAANLGVEKHYGYAFQWFGMSAVMALLYLWYQMIKPRIRHPKDPKPHAQ
jgi:surfeit locus 1 family protein